MEIKKQGSKSSPGNHKAKPSELTESSRNDTQKSKMPSKFNSNKLRKKATKKMTTNKLKGEDETDSDEDNAKKSQGENDYELNQREASQGNIQSLHRETLKQTLEQTEEQFFGIVGMGIDHFSCKYGEKLN